MEYGECGADLELMKSRIIELIGQLCQLVYFVIMLS